MSAASGGRWRVPGPRSRAPGRDLRARIAVGAATVGSPGQRVRGSNPLTIAGGRSGPTLERSREALLSERIPLEEGGPVRLLLVRGTRGDRLLFSASHAVTDGVGLVALASAVAAAYAGRAPSRANHARLGRGSVPPARAVPFGARPARSPAERWFSDWLDPPAQIASCDGDDQPGYLIRHATVAAVPRPPRPATVNDLLLAALMATLERWNRGLDQPADRLSILLPIDLRDGSTRPTFVNASLPALVSTRAADRADLGGLLAAIVTQTEAIKADPAAATGTDLYRMAGAVPPAVRRFLPLPSLFRWMGGNRLVPTAVLSNLGLVDDKSFGGGAAREMWFSPPARSPLGMAVGAVSFGGRLQLSFRTQRRRMSGKALEEFAGHYVGVLADLLDHLGRDAGQRL